ncbi:helix-turn-helix transcriptional regulator [Streptomyces sp. NPDC087440]|uniref:helix-turn-helix transcriptional regulator n=1 Tax=Streptomyces sp. NPDC087440 TaxID=3365790 RepID=UPI0037FB9243
MPPVFAHGRLRLYLLKLLDEAPRHGYEVIRLLEERFQGLYAPSAGTVYPRLAKLEAEGLVTHATEGGRKVYSITDAGRAELADRGGELADLEMEIRESVSELAAEIRDDVRSAAGDLRREMKAQAAASGTSATPGKESGGDWGTGGPWGDKEAWRTAKEEMRKARQEWKEQARRAKDESRRARQDAQDARRQAKETADRAREHMQQAARRVEEQVREHVSRGDWPSAVRDGLAEIEKEFTRAWGKDFGRFGKGGQEAPKEAPDITVERTDRPAPSSGNVWEDAVRDDTPTSAPLPDWAHEDTKPGTDPARELDRLLDRFRDDIRDTARDHGVTASQLADARARLAGAAAHIGHLLRDTQK